MCFFSIFWRCERFLETERAQATPDSSNSHHYTHRGSGPHFVLLNFTTLKVKNKFKATVNLDLIWNRDWTKVKERIKTSVSPIKCGLVPKTSPLKNERSHHMWRSRAEEAGNSLFWRKVIKLTESTLNCLVTLLALPCLISQEVLILKADTSFLFSPFFCVTVLTR